MRGGRGRRGGRRAGGRRRGRGQRALPPRVRAPERELHGALQRLRPQQQRALLSARRGGAGAGRGRGSARTSSTRHSCPQRVAASASRSLSAAALRSECARSASNTSLCDSTASRTAMASPTSSSSTTSSYSLRGTNCGTRTHRALHLGRPRRSRRTAGPSHLVDRGVLLGLPGALRRVVLSAPAQRALRRDRRQLLRRFVHLRHVSTVTPHRTVNDVVAARRPDSFVTAIRENHIRVSVTCPVTPRIRTSASCLVSVSRNACVDTDSTAFNISRYLQTKPWKGLMFSQNINGTASINDESLVYESIKCCT